MLLTGPRRRKGSRLLAGVALLGTGLLAAACGPASLPGGSSNAAPGGGSAGVSAACRLFTDAEIGAAAGRSLTKHDGVDAALIGQSTCVYQGTDPSAGLQTFIFYNPKAMELYQSNESSAEHIADLGDDACWSQPLQSLFVRKGTHALDIIDIGSVTLDGSADSSHRDAFVALARKALPKL